MASILEEMFSAKRAELNTRRQVVPIDTMKMQAFGAPMPRNFVRAIGEHKPAIIAEVKRASPSKGDIFPGLNPATVAREYAENGAAAISVLTDRHFKGTLADLAAVRGAVELPILRKDFIFDPYQVYESRAAGADCVLLIAAMLEQDRLRELAMLAGELGLAALVEVHNEQEFGRAHALNVPLIGINNRDLHTFKTDIATTIELLLGYQGSALMVSESGIEKPAHIRQLYAAGARAFLIGESLLRGGDPGPRLSRLASCFDAAH
jgi:indole-3-glycerol phosphate synthase